MANRLPALGAMLGSACLLLSALASWFHFPAGDGFGSIASREAPIAFACRALSGGFGLWVLAYRGRGEDRPKILARRAAALLALLLFFPQLVMTWSPATSAEANWLYLQHKSLTWFGGDIFGLQEIKDFGWKSQVQATDLLESATAVSAPAVRPLAIPFRTPSGLFVWFGYSNAFCQFVKNGFGLGLLGCSILVISGSSRNDRAALRATIATGSAVACVGVAVGLVIALASAFQLDRARSAVERGYPELGLERIEMACVILPMLRSSSDLTLQRGLLEARLGRDTPESNLYRAKVLQAEGIPEQAEALLGPLLGSNAAMGAVRREATRAFLRRGIRELNSGETSLAIQSLEAVLAVDPSNIKANYVLQLAYLRAARFDSLRRLAVTMRAVYRSFNDETKLPILAATQENIAYAAYLQNDPTTAFSLWKVVSDPARVGAP